jgi:hypothetical protein
MKDLWPLTVLLLLCLIQKTHAQQKRIDFFPDSIRIELPQHRTLVVFETKKYEDNKMLIESFPTFLKELLNHVQKSMPTNFTETGPYKINVLITHETEDEVLGFGKYTFDAQGEKTNITIVKKELLETQVTVKQNKIVELKPPGWELIIQTKMYKAILYADGFQGLAGTAQEDFSEVGKAINNHTDLKFMGRKSIRSRMIVDNGKVVQDTLSASHPGDILSINLQGGLGFYQDKFYPELSVSTAILFRDRYNRARTKIEVNYSGLFFAERKTEGGFQTHVNSFLSLSYGKNFFGQSGDPHWTGIGAGLLVNKSGDYFKGKTLKLFFFNDIGNSRLQVIPEFYLTNDFKDFNYGIKLKYNF